MLLSAGYDVPKQLFVHGYLLLDDKKISKSLGNVIDPLELIDVYGADAVRYWMARAVSFGQDGSASVDRRAGALRQRARERPRQPAVAHDGDGRALPRRHRQAGRAPTGRSTSTRSAPTSPRDSTRSTSRARSMRSGMRVRKLNQYVTAEAPWQLAKDEANAERLDARALHARRRPDRDSPSRSTRICPETSPKILAALRPARGLRRGSRVRTARPRRRRHRRRPSRSSRASSCRPPLRDRHARASRRARRSRRRRSHARAQRA